MTSALPQGWTWATVDDLGDYLNGMAFKPKDWTPEGTPIIRIQNLTDDSKPLNRTKRAYDQKYGVTAGDLLVSWSATLDAFIWQREDAILNQHIFKVTPSGAVEARFLYYALKEAIAELAASEHLHGSTMKHINRGPFLAHALPLPPLAEQRRIVAKLDQVMARTARARAELARIPALIAHHRRAVLAAAFKGELTADWRASNPSLMSSAELARVVLSARAKVTSAAIKASFEPAAELDELPEGWAWLPVDALASKVVDGVHKKPTYVESGVPFLTVRNLTAGPGISFTGCRFVTPADHIEFVKRTNPENGDILVTKDGTLGTIRAIRTDATFCIFVSLALIKVVDRSMTDYLELALQSPAVQAQMVGVGSGLQHIHLVDLRQDMVPLAPPSERAEIVRRIQSAFTWLDKVAHEHAQATRLLDRLDQALLAKAFRGELVLQDPTDEPAAALLARIRAEREGAAPSVRKRKARA